MVRFARKPTTIPMLPSRLKSPTEMPTISAGMVDGNAFRAPKIFWRTPPGQPPIGFFAAGATNPMIAGAGGYWPLTPKAA